LQFSLPLLEEPPIKDVFLPLIVDVFNHFYPKEYLEALPKSLPDQVSYVSSTLKAITDCSIVSA
jgi:hypothetical protein